MTGRWILVASACAACAVWLSTDAYSVRRVHRLVHDMQVRSAQSRTVRLRSAVRRTLRRRREQADHRHRILASLTALTSELQAGQSPAIALQLSAGEPSSWPRASAAARAHADVASSLRLDAAGNDVLVHLAACWEVSARSGAGLAMAVERLAESARRTEDARVQLEAHLAGPRATAKVLAFLPLIGIVLGTMLGAQPLTWLTTSAFGWACLALGTLLTVLGAWWVRRIAAHVEAQA